MKVIPILTLDPREKERQALRLKQLGCKIYQGPRDYLYAATDNRYTSALANPVVSFHADRIPQSWQLVSR